MELSGTEIILIFLIALLVLGPDEMVKYAVKLGRFAAKMRTQFENFKKMTQDELLKRADLNEDSSLNALGGLREQMKSLEADLNKTLSDGRGSVLESSAEKLEHLSAEAVENNLMGMGPKDSSGG